MINFEVKLITCKEAKAYIRKNHYSKSCHNGPKPCYGLFDKNKIIGCLVFATPCSEAVRESVFGKEYKDTVTELHRLYIKNNTPKNTESYFISRCLKNLLIEKSQIRGVLSFSDTTENHTGLIYQATNAFYCGQSTKRTFFIDENGALRHPRQCGINISLKDKPNWKKVKRFAKNRYLWIIGPSKAERKKYKKLLKLEVLPYPSNKNNKIYVS